MLLMSISGLGFLLYLPPIKSIMKDLPGNMSKEMVIVEA